MFYIRSRRSWSSRTANLTHTPWKGKRKPVRVHHTAGKWDGGTARQERAHLQDLEHYHVSVRDYQAIGYNYLIFPSGRTYEGRGFEKLGAHTLSHNSDIGVCFVGNYDQQKLTLRARASFVALRAKLAMKGARCGPNYGHSETFATSCPGKYVRKALGL